MVSPREVEVAAENYWKSLGYVTRRALRTKWAKVDFFGADVIAKDPMVTVYCQVTKSKTSGNIAARRRKLEKIPWVNSDKVYVFELREQKDIINRNKLNYYFRIHEYNYIFGKWHILDDAVEVPREWFKVHPGK